MLSPTVAPFLTSAPGPNGETAELELANLQIDFVQDTPQGTVSWLTLAVDAPLGFDLAYDPVAGQLAPTITPPPGSAVAARVVDNAIGADEPNIEALFPSLFPTFVGGLSDSFARLPAAELPRPQARRARGGPRTATPSCCTPT